LNIETLNITSLHFQLHRDPWGRLIYTDAEGRSHSGVIPARAFPVSDPDHWVSICDSQGQEILWIERLADVPQEARQLLEDELDRREFVPVIKRIVSVTTEEPSQWSVETDRGPTTFQIQSEDDVRRVEPFQASVLDAHGIRYLIPDYRALDGSSRRLLDHFL
jgi:hypothetical protein